MNRSARLPLLLACGVALSAGGSHVHAADPEPALQLVLKQTPPTALVPTVLPESFVFSPNARRTAYLAAGGQKVRVVVDGEAGKEYDEVVSGSLMFSPDSRHTGYIARDGQKFRRVLDGREGPAYDAIQAYVFSPDSQHTAYLTMDNRTGARVIVDAAEGREYEFVWKDTLTFSPDSKRVAYIGRRGEKGKKGAPVPADGIPRGGWRLVVDGKEGKSYELAHHPLTFSPDSRRIAYFVTTSAGASVVVDGKEGPVYESLMLPGVVFSPDSQHFAYGARKGTSSVMVADGAEGKPYALAVLPTYSPDSHRLAYMARQDDKNLIVLDGKEGPAFDGMTPVIPDGPGEGNKRCVLFSPDSRHFVYGARRGMVATVVLDGAEGKGFSDGLGSGSLSYSPDSTRIAYTAGRDGKVFVVVDGVESAPYDAVDGFPVFSPDSKHAAWAAALGKPTGEEGRRLLLAVDGASQVVKDSFGLVPGTPLRWDSPTTLHALAATAAGPSPVDLQLSPR